MRNANRTTARRIKKRIEVRYGKDKPSYPGFSGNISMTGMMIRTTRVYGPGTSLTVEIKTPEGAFLVGAKVEWARAGTVRLLQTGRIGMGIRFMKPSEEFLSWVSERQSPAS